MVKAAGVTRNITVEPFAIVPNGVLGHIWQEAFRQRPDPTLPTQAGFAIPPYQFDLVDHLVETADTVGHGFQIMSLYLRFLSKTAKIRFSHHDGDWIWDLRRSFRTVASCVGAVGAGQRLRTVSARCPDSGSIVSVCLIRKTTLRRDSASCGACRLSWGNCVPVRVWQKAFGAYPTRAPIRRCAKRCSDWPNISSLNSSKKLRSSTRCDSGSRMRSIAVLILPKRSRLSSGFQRARCNDGC